MVTHTAPASRRDVFQAIADPNRRAIIRLLSQQRLTLNGIAQHFPISRPAISKHIRILEECGIVEIEQRGRERFCEVRLENLNEVADWIEPYRTMWMARLDALGEYLDAVQRKKKRPLP